jgi:hypothetical protein
MNSFILSVFCGAALFPAVLFATDVVPPLVFSNSSTPLSSNAPVPLNTPASPKDPVPALTIRELPEIHATILLPKDWTLLPGKLLEGDELLATRDQIATPSDPWTTGLSMSIDRNGAKDSGQKASVYAINMAREARQKAGDEATPIQESQCGSFHDARFDFVVNADQPLLFTEILRANDTTGTLTVILWQSLKKESAKLQELKEQILAGIKLDPTL